MVSKSLAYISIKKESLFCKDRFIRKKHQIRLENEQINS